MSFSAVASFSRAPASILQIALLLLWFGRPVLADSTVNCAIAPPVPSVPKSAKTFTGSTGSDETAAIQQALNGLQTGDWLVFPAGTYNISQHLTVLTSGVTLFGAGATIHSSNAVDGALWIKSDDVAVYGFTLQQDSSSRQSTPWAGGISVYDDRDSGTRTVRGAVIQNNTINNSAATGIFIDNVENFTIANNTVWRSWADGIHMTGGAFAGRAINNTVSQTGDDMIAVVSYAAGRTPAPASSNYANWPAVQANLDRNIYIAGNTLADQYWGRGISVVGGSDVTIANNSVALTPMAAAVYLTRETSYMTFGDHDILVTGNTLSQIQTIPPSYKPPNFNIALTGQGAIEIGSTLFADEYANPTWREAFSMANIAIVGNTVNHASVAGIRIGVGYSNSATVTAANGITFVQTSLPGAVEDVLVQNNAQTDVNSVAVIEAHSGLDSTAISCENNTLNGAQWRTKCTSAILGAGLTLSVAGASIQCAADGAFTPLVSPEPPTLIHIAPGS